MYFNNCIVGFDMVDSICRFASYLDYDRLFGTECLHFMCQLSMLLDGSVDIGLFEGVDVFGHSIDTLPQYMLYN